LAGHQEEHPTCKILRDKMLAGVVICLERGVDNL